MAKQPRLRGRITSTVTGSVALDQFRKREICWCRTKAASVRDVALSGVLDIAGLER
jgi:hypothetical protein